MDDMKDFLSEMSEPALKYHRKHRVRKYLVDNWIAIAALILSVISIILQVVQ